MSDFFKQQPLILASGSRSRFKLLQALGLDFEVIPSHCDEEFIKQDFVTSTSFTDLAIKLACCKAVAVSLEYPQAFVIGADQLCVLGQQYLDKPIIHETAFKQLRLLSGKKHQQVSAFCLAKAGSILWQGYELANLTMRELSDETIEAYLMYDKPYQSCGSYHYEGQAKWLFEKVEGSDSTIQGLPLGLLSQVLINAKVVSLSP